MRTLQLIIRGHKALHIEYTGIALRPRLLELCQHARFTPYASTKAGEGVRVGCKDPLARHGNVLNACLALFTPCGCGLVPSAAADFLLLVTLAPS
jgi:hypothetical protein